MVVYISGPISGNPDYKKQFEAASERLLKKGHVTVNPAENEAGSYREYIDIGLAQLGLCDAIYMLEGYEHSDGAKLELHYARICGLHVFIEGQTVMDKIGRTRND